ncbi:hypothetical protein PR001_g18217 [Phytophthora rubi]|uniref:ATP-dependent DNA helicase n=1 Tax=Phytophthora rubi TaxID=129364 RepID=A0A6A3K6A7_9STRA|nr:hypothetical protein PR001_g18217 [Phytophthora rubi]
MGHYLGSLLPRIDRFTNEPVPPKFARIYIVDPDMQQRAERRRGIFADLDSGTLLDIEQMMAEHNPFAQQFLNYAEKLRADRAEGKDVVDLVYRLHEKKSNPRTHNLPTVSEVGATLIEDSNLDKPRDILLWAKDHRLLRLFELNSVYDPLQYPLLLPHGESGWAFTDEYADNIERRSKREMSLREHVAYRLFQKVDDELALHQGGRLFQQYCVDQRAKCEQEQLRWIASHQAELRAEQYRGVQDALLNEPTTVLNEGEGLLTEYDRETGTLQHPDGDQRRPDHFLNQIGKRIVLPSTHSGSRRAMYKSYQYSMAIVREYGKPDVFVTMTCNPTWEEIEEKIPEPNQSAQDRPDIVARVWQQKLAELLKDVDEGVLGRVMARIYVVEFQKRGLPHAHILVILADEDKPRRREIIDKLVSAELPDAELNPRLYETTLTSMMHGPCGAANPNSPCMKDGKCTKGYPKPLVEVTQGNVNGFPVYRHRRRPPGVLKFRGREYDNATINQWVVPYNPYLSQKYNCHINVEVCTALTAVKYLYKYVYKGSDKAVITIETVNGESHRGTIEPNEILRYLNARYISPVEACMRLLDFSVQGKTHSIVQLTIHLENEQLVTFRSSDNPDQVLTRGRHTMLTRFFELCASEAPENQEAKAMVYQDIPKKFRWDAKPKKRVRRKQFQAAIGRMVHVSPRDMNKFYMRVLLCRRKGPQSFEQLRTVDGVTYETGRCAQEAVRTPTAFRDHYRIFQVSEIRQLWDQFYDDLSQDYAYTYRALQGQEKEDLIQFKTLKSLHDLLQINGYAVADFDDLPQLHQYPALVVDSLLRNSLLRRELEGYDQSILQSIVDQENQLNDGQRAIYDEILQAVDGTAVGEKLFIIDGPGGTGKSTLLRHILAKVRLSGKIAIAVASSGIASLLLMGAFNVQNTSQVERQVDVCDLQAIQPEDADSEGQFGNLG